MVCTEALMDGENGDRSSLFSSSLCGRRHEELVCLEERDLGPMTKETELRLGLPGDWLDEENNLSEDQLPDNVHKLQKGINHVGAKRVFWETTDGFPTRDGSTHSYNKPGCLPSWPSKTQPLSSSSHLPNIQNNFYHCKPNLAMPREPSPVVTEPDDRKTDTSGLERVVVGWPPLRSFRKNIGASSSKLTPVEKDKHVVVDSINGNHNKGGVKKGLFVKINMDGVPIGRKIDLHAYDCYQKLAIAVDVLFRNLLAAQNVSNGEQRHKQEEKPITGLLDGYGEYTLVYEDIEGDRMLVGDVPWKMFVSSVKRLRVSKSADLSGMLVPNSNVKREDKKPSTTAN